MISWGILLPSILWMFDDPIEESLNQQGFNGMREVTVHLILPPKGPGALGPKSPTMVKSMHEKFIEIVVPMWGPILLLLSPLNQHSDHSH